jgi:hypothetical protein
MFDLLANNADPQTVQLSNGILVHNKINLDALGLSSYKEYFQKSKESLKEFSSQSANFSSESANFSCESALEFDGR